MTGQGILQPIYDALAANNVQEAHRLTGIAISRDGGNATLHYLQGRAFMKESKWGQAISSFKRAEELDPDSPARECRLMLNDIMDFFNKDMYNQ